MKIDKHLGGKSALGWKNHWGGLTSEIPMQSSALVGSGWRTSPKADSGFFWIGSLEQHHQFLLGGPARPVKLQRFDRALVGTATGPQQEQERGDQHAVNLDRHPGGRLGQPVTAVEDRLDPLEEEFDLPTLPVNQTDQLGGQILPRGDQMKHVAAR